MVDAKNSGCLLSSQSPKKVDDGVMMDSTKQQQLQQEEEIQKNHHSNNNHNHNRKMKAYLFMFLLALQFGIQPIVTRQYTSIYVIRSTVLFVQEIVKFIIAFSMFFSSSNQKELYEIKQGWTLQQWFRVAFLPAGLYSIQNMMALTAYQHLDALTFNVLNQTKTLSAAMCCYLVMKKQQSFIQIIALLLLLLSALVIERIIQIRTLFEIVIIFLSTGQLQFHNDNNNNNNDATKVTTSRTLESQIGSKHFTHGVAPILVASFISGLAGAISQKNVQIQKDGSPGRNIYLFSMELCLASIVLIGITILLGSPDGIAIQQNGFWYGWTTQTWIPIITNSAGGIIVGLVTKYAGSVQKGFALIFGILLSGIIQAIYHPDKVITMEQWTGGFLAAISLYLHSSYPPQSKQKSTTTQQTSTTCKKNLKIE